MARPRIIRERTQAGLAAARARGRQGGRARAEALNTPQWIALAQALHRDKSHSIADICRTLHISRATLYRYITPAPKQRALECGEAAHNVADLLRERLDTFEQATTEKEYSAVPCRPLRESAQGKWSAPLGRLNFVVVFHRLCARLTPVPESAYSPHT